MTPIITPARPSARTSRTPAVDPLAELLRLREASVDAVVIPNRDLVSLVDAIRAERHRHEIAMSALAQQNADLYDRLNAAPSPRRNLVPNPHTPSAHFVVHKGGNLEQLFDLGGARYAQHDLDEVERRIAEARNGHQAARAAGDAAPARRAVIVDGWDLDRL